MSLTLHIAKACSCLDGLRNHFVQLCALKLVPEPAALGAGSGLDDVEEGSQEALPEGETGPLGGPTPDAGDEQCEEDWDQNFRLEYVIQAPPQGMASGAFMHVIIKTGRVRCHQRTAADILFDECFVSRTLD